MYEKNLHGMGMQRWAVFDGLRQQVERRGFSPTTTPTASCATDKRVVAYAPNLKVKGDTLSIQLLTSDPAPPGVDLNTWTFKVLKQDGTAISGANVKIAPYMPDHGHGPSVVPSIAAAGDTYTATNVDLFMPGVWQITFSIDAAGTLDQVVMDFCVAG